MNPIMSMLFVLIIFCISVSCSQTKTDKGEAADTKIHNNYLSSTAQKDTLNFTSGVRSIFQDSKGNYWFGSHQEGVCLFDGKSFEYFTSTEGLSDNQIRSIQEDTKGNIWLGTANGVRSYDGEKFTSHINIEHRESQHKWSKTDNDLWFNAPRNQGVYRYGGETLHYLAFPNLQEINPNNSYLVTGISQGKDDMVWFGTYAGVIGYNGDEFSVMNDETLGLNNETGLLHIRSILEDSKGRLWIGNNGIGVLLKENGTTINFSEKHNLIHSESSRSGGHSPAGTLEHVFVITEDADGNIWFGDRDTGAWKYDGKTTKHYTIDSALSSFMVWSIYSDRDNNLLFGMAERGVYKFNGKSFDRIL